MATATQIFHITHLANLPRIVAGGLRCDADCRTRDATVQNIGHQHVKDRRLLKKIPGHPEVTVGDFVPFYFAPRSPMLHTIDQVAASGSEDGQSNVLHLHTTVERVASAGHPCLFTDGRASHAFTRFFAQLALLSRVDWSLMSEDRWHDTLEDGDRVRRRAAEFLVRQALPWSLIEGIGVHTEAVAIQVRRLLDAGPHRPDVRVEPSWYY